MNTAPARQTAWRSLLALMLSILVALGGSLIAAAPASAAPGDVSGATLQWGLKESFRNYISGPIAHGAITVDGVTATPAFGWSGGSGTSSHVAFPGSVQFTGHDGILDVTISDIALQLNGDTTATIFASIVSKNMGSGEFETFAGVEFATVDLMGTLTTTDALITATAAPAVLTEAGAAGFAGFYAAGSALDPVTFSVPVEVAPAPEPASLSVSKSTGLNPDGEEITVTGSNIVTGFVNKHVRPGVVNEAGVYAQIGYLDEEWRASEGAEAATRSNAFSTWVKEEGAPPSYTVWTDNGDGTADFTWTVTVTKAELDAVARDGATLAVFTSGAGGVVQAANELAVPISFATESDAPSLTVSKSTELNPDGAEITVTGSNIVTGFVNKHVRPGVVNEAGVYAQIGYLDTVWRPSEGAESSSRSNAFSTWVKEGGEAPSYTVWTDNGDGTADFTWTVTVTKAELDAVARDGATLAVFTSGAGGVVQAANELSTPIAFAAATTPPVTTPETPVTPTVPTSAGSLSWGIKESFRNYVAGPIAHGTISTTGAGTASGAFVFAQASGGSYTTASATGTSNYSGAVTFTGHEGALNLTISSPRVHVTSATSASLSVLSNGTRVTVANLNLAASARSVTGGAVTYKNVPATLTSQGTTVFALNGSPFYAAGTALDPVTFTIGAPKAATGGTTVIASFTPAVTKTPAATPPATTGLDIEGDLVEGGDVTITASGFEPNETGILVVIYSEPMMLANDATADASGTATWTGALPEGLTGEHTLTMQGSVDRGILVDIAAAEMTTTAADTCAVTNATLDWGFKEAFRSYISGAIAHGEWTVADGASYETPLFGWSDGTGSYDTATSSGEVSFAGSIRFTGHEGILDTTVSNPRIELIDADTAYIVLDIAGDTRDGESVEQTGVRFVKLDLAGGTDASTDGNYSVEGAPAVITELGSATFGTYEAGTEFDPVTFSIPLADGCDAAPISEPGAVEPISAASDNSWMLWVALAVIVLLAAALTIVLLRRRKAQRV